MATNYQGSFRVGGNPNNPFGSIINLLIFFVVLAGMYFFIGGVFKLLYLVAPVLLIATLIINYRIVADYAIDVFETFRTDILWGAVKVAFTVLCYPLVIGWLFAKSLIYRKVDKLKQEFDAQVNAVNPNLGSKTTTEFADFEELSSEVLKKTEKKEPPIIVELPKPKEKQQDDYDQFFK
jgi:hypothetical protein